MRILKISRDLFVFVDVEDISEIEGTETVHRKFSKISWLVKQSTYRESIPF